MSEFNQMMNKKAVALQYDEQKNISPVIVASGSGLLAEKIIEVANDNGVPVYEDNSLASVLSRLDLGSNIPVELYEAIVDIYVFFLKYSPKAQAHLEAKAEEERKAAEAVSAASEPAIIKAESQENNPENATKTVEDENSIEYKTRELLKELTIDDTEGSDDGVQPIPWLPKEF